VVSFFLSFFFFPRLISAVQIGCLPYFHTWCGPSANLECMFEMYCTACTRLAGNAGCKKIAVWVPSHNFVGLYHPNYGTYRQSEKVLSSNISSTCLHNMVNFGLLEAEIASLVWDTPANFNDFRILASLLQRRRSTEANQTLHVVWPSPGLVHYIYIFGVSCPVTEFCQVQNSPCIHQVLRSRILAALLHGT